MPNIADLFARSLWTQSLTPAEHDRIRRDTVERCVPAQGFVCRRGEPVEHWIGVVDGLVKMTNLSADGKPTTFTGVPTGGWFGEGSLLKDEPRRYDIMALRESRIAYLPRSTFLWLMDHNIAFNRFLINQLNERLAQFIATVEHDRLLNPDARVARGLASMFNPLLYPGLNNRLEISQEELGYLAGLSRQRVNQSLKLLEQAGLIKLEYGGITVLNMTGLKTFGG